MSRIKTLWQKNKDAMNTKSAKVGGYSFFVSVIMLAILIAVNILASVIPTKYTQFDISSSRLYSVTSSTKVVAQNLTKDVTIYWIVQAGKEDSIMEKLLTVYEGLSDHITVTKKDPDVYPTFAKEYTEETVSNNSLIVESGDTYRYIPYSDIYEYDTSNYYSTGQTSVTGFDGEGAITAAIDFVVSDNLPILYTLTGHGEAALGESIQKAIERANIQVKDFSLLTVDEIPEDANCIMINAPTQDISEDEKGMLRNYIHDGGKLMVLSGPQAENELPNLRSILSEYGVEYVDGLVVEGNRSYYAFGQPYVMLPEVQSSAITDTLADNNSFVIVSLAQGLTLHETQNGDVISLLKTSDDAFSKADGFNLSTYDKEENDTDGPFTLAVSIEGTTDGKIVWASTDYMLDETCNSYSAGANLDFTMNSLSWLIGETESISIRSKSLEYSYLTISETNAAQLRFLLIGLLPAGYLLFGIANAVTRRKAR